MLSPFPRAKLLLLSSCYWVTREAKHLFHFDCFRLLTVAPRPRKSRGGATETEWHELTSLRENGLAVTLEQG